MLLCSKQFAFLTGFTLVPLAVGHHCAVSFLHFKDHPLLNSESTSSIYSTYMQTGTKKDCYLLGIH
jgi:hypothetical protein